MPKCVQVEFRFLPTQARQHETKCLENGSTVAPMVPHWTTTIGHSIDAFYGIVALASLARTQVAAHYQWRVLLEANLNALSTYAGRG